MPNCEKCRACFRDNYNLKKHMSRLRPCMEEKKNSQKKEEPKCTQDEPKCAQNEPKCTQNEQKITQNEQKCTFCVFCTKSFSNKSSLQRHSKKCKYKEDPVRLIELKLNKINNIHKLICRFCKKKFKKTNASNKINFSFIYILIYTNESI